MNSICWSSSKQRIGEPFCALSSVKLKLILKQLQRPKLFHAACFSILSVFFDCEVSLTHQGYIWQ